MEGLAIYDNSNYDTSIDDKIMILNQVSWLYQEKKDYKKSIDYAKRALELEKQFSDPYHRVESFEFLSTSYLETGDKEKSRFYMDKYTFLKDSLAVIDRNNSDVVMKKVLAESDHNNKENLRKQVVLMSALFLTAAITALIFWRRKNKRMRKSYESIIEKLKIETINNSQTIITDKTEDELPKSYSKNSIASETEIRILRKLDVFEKTEKYTNSDVTISLLSNQWDTNPKYLSEIIRNSRFQNFNNYINSLRISYIVHKLYNEPKYREYKISYLAEECSYASLRYL